MKQGTVGTYGSESLPNITGSATIGHTSAVFPISNGSVGCFSATNSRTFGTAAGNTTITGFSELSFNASLSSSTYQNNVKVNPDNAEIMYVIKY